MLNLQVVDPVTGATYVYAINSPYVRPTPDATNTGYGDVELRPYTGQFGQIINGRLTLTTPGVVIDGYRIPAWVDNRTTDVVLTHNLFEPAMPPVNSAGVGVSAGIINSVLASAKRLHVEQNQLRPQPAAISPNFTAFLGHDMTILKNDWSGVVDGLQIQNTADLNAGNVIAEDNYGHGYAWFTGTTPGETHADGSHCDACQIINCSNIRLVNNNFQTFVDSTIGSKSTASHGNSAIQVTGTVHDLTIIGGLYDGGVYTVNVGTGTYSNWALSYMRFGRHQSVGSAGNPGKPISLPRAANAVLTGLVWDDTHLAVPSGLY